MNHTKFTTETYVRIQLANKCLKSGLLVTFKVYYKCGYFCRGKFCENVLKTFYLGVIFIRYYFFDKVTWVLFFVQGIFWQYHKKRDNYPCANISSFTVYNVITLNAMIFDFWHTDLT